MVGTVHRSSALRTVPNVNHTVFEASLIEEFQVNANLAWQIRIAATHNNRRDEYVVLVDKTSPNGVGSQRRTAHRNIPIGVFLQLAYSFRVKLPLEPGLRGRHRV
jgi:hypothetical protein